MIAEMAIDLIITDLKMPVMSGYELMKAINALPRHPPTIVITGSGDVRSAVLAMKSGAFDFLPKPFRAGQLQEAVNAALIHPRRQDGTSPEASPVDIADPRIEPLLAKILDGQTSEPVLDVLVTALDAREEETGRHSHRVSRIARLLGEQCGITGAALRYLERGALLHDIGKIGVSDRILLKPHRLNSTEWNEMRRHPDIGARIASKAEALLPAVDVIHFHHERFDGTGYPRGLRGDSIPMAARVFTVVDSLDAMITDRPYRKAKSVGMALEEIQGCSGTQFDPEIAYEFLNLPPHLWQSHYSFAAKAAG